MNSDPKVAVFQVLGFAYDSLSEPEAYTLLCDLLRCSHMKCTTEPRIDTLGPFTEHPPRQPRQSNPTSEATLPSETRNEENLGKYTSALNERGQAEKKKVQYTVSKLDSDPPQFKVTIRFGTSHASGIGAKKKTAGHLAAKKLCRRLCIMV